MLNRRFADFQGLLVAENETVYFEKDYRNQALDCCKEGADHDYLSLLFRTFSVDIKLGGQNMIPQSCLLIETTKFPILDGEKDEITNENMYGKALCQYLQSRLPSTGVNVPFFCNEDWGWWLETNRNGFKMALCIYSDPDANPNPEKYAILPSINEAKKWSWSKFKSIDNSRNVLETISVVEKLFRNDSDIRMVTRHDDYPF